MLRPSRLLTHARRILANDQFVLGLLGFAVGAAVGGAVVLFRETILLIQSVFLGTGEERLYLAIRGLPGWQLVLAPTLGGLIVGLFIRYLLPGGRPQGVASVIAAADGDGRIPPWTGIAAALAAATSIGTGASVGREGPAVHLGATVGLWLARMMRLTPSLARSLLGCGVAAAVAASFNAPIAGALFAHEVIRRSTITAFAPVVISSVTATVISREWFGNFPAFVVPALHTGSLAEFPAHALLGIPSGVAAAALIRAILAAETGFTRLPLRPEFRPAIGGFALGLIALAFPQVLGIGYDITGDALSGAMPLRLLAILVLAKSAATVLSLGSGFAGGVFGPSIAIGALLGGAYGEALAQLFPGAIGGSGSYALVGMASVAAAVLGAPISTPLIVFELTGDYELTLFAMLGAAVATMAARSLLRPHLSFFDAQLDRQAAKDKSPEP